MLLIVYSVMFFPFFDHLVSIFFCTSSSGSHYLIASLKCYSSQHIILMLLSCIALVIFLFVNLLVATLYNETLPAKKDALARLDSNFEILMVLYRLSMSIISIFFMISFCPYIIVFISFISSIYFLK